MASERKSILVVTLSNIGDVILTTPVIAALHSRFPGAKLTVVVGPKAAGILKGSALIDRLLIYDKESSLGEKLKLVRKLREEFYDYVVDLRNSAFPFLVRAWRRSSIFRPHREIAARDYHLEVLKWMKLRPPAFQKFDFFSKKEEESLWQKLRQKGVPETNEMVLLAPGAGSEQKRWCLEGFTEVAQGLFKSHSFSIYTVGDSREVLLGKKLAEIDSRIINLAGAITLRELGALVSRAKLVVTNDSACMHLAYELERPAVALFGPSNPERYGRKSEIWKILRPDSSMLQDLSSEQVLLACQSLLQGRAVGQKP